jgi:hypothetical protein
MNISERLSLIEDLARVWDAAIPGIPLPPTNVFASWVLTYDEAEVVYAIGKVSKKARRMQLDGTAMNTEDVVRYAASIMRNEKLGVRKFDPPKSSTSTTRAKGAQSNDQTR